MSGRGNSHNNSQQEKSRINELKEKLIEILKRSNLSEEGFYIKYSPTCLLAFLKF
jgi:hypothetical protein